MTRLQRLRAVSHSIRTALTPSPHAWRGAATGVILLAVFVALFFFSSYFLQDFTLQKMPAFIARVGSVFLAGTLALGATMLLARLPAVFRWPLFVFAPFVILVMPQGEEGTSLLAGALLVLIAALIGGGLGSLRRSQGSWRKQRMATAALCSGIFGLAAGLYVTFSVVEEPNPWMQDYQIDNRTLELPNPGLPGSYEVQVFSYGSGKDRHRDEFAADVDVISRTVDGAALLDNWDGFSGWLRSSFWGFGPENLPLQATVWRPAGEGPYPLVLIVHGNHSMEDYSDPGYAYLGELFASRGIVFASVDENFLNSSISAWVDLFADRPGLKEENDARGWLLLQHLAQWRDWMQEPGHSLQGLVDIDRVALIGHSRGGEAVAVAAAFNSLDRYPDDAAVEFDFKFNLRGVIAIAPVDGQYQPRDNGTPIRDVNYFTVHGSMDGDVQSFDGTAQYSRVGFSGDDFRFRSSLYIDGANHGQFNTTWGNMDTSIFRAWALDLSRIMDGEQQRDIARVYFSAFMEIVLNGRDEYLPVFTDLRFAADWLPPQFYINQYSDSRHHVITDYEEDIDPATLSLRGGRIETSGLSRWYEVANSIKYDDLETHAAVYAWDDRYEAGDEPASLRWQMPAGGLALATGDELSFSLADAGVATLPDSFQIENSEEQSGEGPAKAIDWTVVLTDLEGNRASLPLSSDDFLYPQIKALPRRAAWLESADASEVLYRRYAFPVAGFLQQNPAFQPTRLGSISFEFDRSPRGAIIVDDLFHVPAATP